MKNLKDGKYVVRKGLMYELVKGICGESCDMPCELCDTEEVSSDEYVYRLVDKPKDYIDRHLDKVNYKLSEFEEKKQMYYIGCGEIGKPISEQTTDKEFDYLIQIDELKKELSDTKLKLYEQKTHVSYHEGLLSWSSKEIERQADLIEKLKKHIGHINSLSD